MRIYTVVEHEMTHEFEFLLDGERLLFSEVWFREGIADHYAGNHAITSVAQLPA
ncbi:MAG: hypothetical protein V1694_00780 [Candidatus Eisenbacteria bacterium]